MKRNFGQKAVLVIRTVRNGGHRMRLTALLPRHGRTFKCGVCGGERDAMHADWEANYGVTAK